jgi:uncharacterized protein YndB with AHSA1/START domain
VADKENDPRWRENVAEIKRISGDGTTGTKYQQVMKAGRKEIQADIEITDYEPGKRVAFRTTAGPIRPTGNFDFVEEGGATRLTFRLEAELPGAKRLMAPMAMKAMRGEVNDSLERLKQVLETG